MRPKFVVNAPVLMAIACLASLTAVAQTAVPKNAIPPPKQAGPAPGADATVDIRTALWPDACSAPGSGGSVNISQCSTARLSC